MQKASKMDEEKHDGATFFVPSPSVLKEDLPYLVLR